jgi:hypothetical protein
VRLNKHDRENLRMLGYVALVGLLAMALVVAAAKFMQH